MLFLFFLNKNGVIMEKNKLRFVIIGGVAAGASAAARARRLSEDAEIIVIERGKDISFANCGMPYFIGGEIIDRSKLALHTPQGLGQLLGIQIYTETEALSIDRQKKVVLVKDLLKNETREIEYDKILLAPGSRPIRPPLTGIQDPRILTLRNLQDMDRIKESVSKSQRVLVVGAGFIGLEMVEMLRHLKKQVSLVELLPQVLPQMDPEMVKQIEIEIVKKGVELILNDGITEFVSEEKQIIAKLKSGKTIAADMVVLSIGIQPESELAEKAGLELGIRKSIKVNEFQLTNDPDIYAAGDVVESSDPILGKRCMIPLAGPANRQGRVVADHIFLKEEAKPYPGTIGTAIARVFDVTAGVTGYTEKRLRQENIPYRFTIVVGNQHASYYPGSVPLTLKLLWDPNDGRVLGGQAIGFDGIDKRLDVLATAIAAKMNIEQLCHLELSYAPPFGNARDILNIAGFSATNIQNGLFVPEYSLDGAEQILDVRSAPIAKANPIPGAKHIPLEQLRNRLNELDINKPVLTVCAIGKSSYFAARTLQQKGFKVKSFVGGWNLRSQKPTSFSPTSSCQTVSSNAGNSCCGSTVPSEFSKNSEKGFNMSNIAPFQLDTCGLSCPGPVMKIKETVGQIKEGQELVVTASDPGFARDFPACCPSMNLEFLGMEESKGITTARARKISANAQSQIANAKTNDGATLVVFSCELDKVLASLVIANGAVAMGGKVTMFFTFWGLNALRKSGKVTVPGKSFMDKMFGWMMPKGPGKLPLSRMNMAGMGTAMMKMRMKQKNLPNIPGLLESAQKSGVRLIACSMSMDAMGIRKEELIDGVEIGGVAEFIAASRQTATNLFI